MALWFPFLPADRLVTLGRSNAAPDAPVAFVEKQKGALRLAAVDPAARELGLQPGTALADARAIVPELVAEDHDPAADARFLAKIADGCMRFSPRVALKSPDGIVLDITGVSHLFGGEEQLSEAIDEWLCKRRLTARLAGASSPEAAHALARFAPSRISDEAAAIRKLPIAALELDADRVLGLQRAGFRTVGDVADRPRAVITARFGAACVFMLERLIGHSEKPLDVRSPKRRFVFERRFAEPVASKDYALGVLRELLAEARTALAQENLGGRAFQVAFCRSDGLTRTVHAETSQPTRDPARIAQLFDERLDTLADPLDPGFGFDSVRLAVLRTEPLAPMQEDIERGSAEAGEVAPLLDRLAARLGRNRLLRFRANDTHIPEKGQVALPAIDAYGPLPWSLPVPGDPPFRPLQLFDPPQRIDVIAEIPDGPPRRFRWRRKIRDVAHHEGPERIAAEWWRSGGDPLGREQLTRDYYRIEDIEGRRYWVFRHGLFGRESANPDWYLHGLFA